MMTYEPLSTPIRVLILDDHKFIGELLAHRLSHDHHITIIGITTSTSAALHLVRDQGADVALVDMELDNDDGVDATRALLDELPTLRVIGLSAHYQSHYPIALLEAGGRGFISKRASTTDVLDGVRRVARGDLAISPDVAFYLATEAKEPGPVKRIRALTAKEIEVLQLISVGCSIDEVSYRLDISAKTVQSHRANMKRKLDLTTDVELCLLALRAGIVSVHDQK